MAYEDNKLGHADDNDGIEEYDNALPSWWLGLFYFTILWAVGYTLDFHFINGRSQEGWYLSEMAAAAEQWPDATGPAVVQMDPAAIEAGKEVYAKNCAACHAADLTGGIGPNLIDDEWIHGGEPDEVANTITEGVPSKGMLTWGPILGPEKISQVTAYILSEGDK